MDVCPEAEEARRRPGGGRGRPERMDAEGPPARAQDQHGAQGPTPASSVTARQQVGKSLPSELARTSRSRDQPFKWGQDDWDPFGERKKGRKEGTKELYSCSTQQAKAILNGSETRM